MKLIYISNARIPSEKANTYQTLCMCEAFAEIGFGVDLWHPSRDLDYKNNGNSAAEELSKLGISKNFIIKRKFSCDFRFLKKLNEHVWFLVRHFSFLVNCFISLIFYCATNSEVIVFTRDAIFSIVLSKIPFLFPKRWIFVFESHHLSDKFLRYMSKNCNLVVLNSKAAHIARSSGFENVLVAHDGVKLDFFSSGCEGPEPLIKLDCSFRYVTYAGKLTILGMEEGIRDFLVSSNDLRDLADVKFLIIGGTQSEIDSFESFIFEKSLDREKIIFIPRVPRNELRYYFKRSSVLAMPYPKNDFFAFHMSPLKLFEYMSVGVPIVCSKLPSISDVLENNVNAILFEPSIKSDLSKALRSALRKESALIATKALSDVGEYQWKKRTEKISDFIKICSKK